MSRLIWAAAALATLCSCARPGRGDAIPLATPGLVLLLREPVALTAESAAGRLKAEFQREFQLLTAGHSGSDPADFVAAESGYLQVAVERDVFRVTHLNRPYVEDVYRWPFVRGHRAWLAVDSLSPTAGTEDVLGRVAVCLAAGDVVAVYLPASDRMVRAPAGLARRLRAGEPFQLLFSEN